MAGIIGLAGFLITGLGWLDATREGIRAMFGQPTLQGNFVITKLRDLVTLATLGVVLLVSAFGGVIVSGAAGWLLGLVGLDGSRAGSVILGAISTLVLLGVDIVVFLVIFELLSGVSVPRADLGDAALFGGIGLGILKLLGGLLLHGAGNNKLVATAGVALGLLVWLNLVSRLTLIAASWGATVAIDRGHLLPEDITREEPQPTFVAATPPGPAPTTPADTASAAGRSSSGRSSPGCGSPGCRSSVTGTPRRSRRRRRPRGWAACRRSSARAARPAA